jgi:hypothetical protein
MKELSDTAIQASFGQCFRIIMGAASSCNVSESSWVLPRVDSNEFEIVTLLHRFGKRFELIAGQHALLQQVTTFSQLFRKGLQGIVTQGHHCCKSGLQPMDTIRMKGQEASSLHLIVTQKINCVNANRPNIMTKRRKIN